MVAETNAEHETLSPRPGFAVRAYQNRYLPLGARDVSAFLTVTGQGLAAHLATPPEAAEIVMIDCSGSMSMPATKIAAARRAVAAAVDTLRDGVFFAIIEGTGRARPVYPATGLVRADERTRAEAKRAAARLVASGGTAMGNWLALARELFATRPTAIRHALLLTDGQNVGEQPQHLDRVLAECAGQFVCDARGIGGDWEPRELQRIATVLNGHADGLRRPADLADDFRQLTEAAMGKVVPNLFVRLRLTPGTRLRFVREAFPANVDLTDQVTQLDERTVEFGTGSWPEQDTREYFVGLTVDPDTDHPVGEDIQLALVSLAATTAGTTEPHAVGTPDSIEAHWTHDAALSSRVHPKVAHQNGQEELHTALMAGFDAFDRDQRAQAEHHWGRAVRLATLAGNAEVLVRLDPLVTVVDAAGGVVRLRDDVRREDLLRAAMSSVIGTRSPQASDELAHPDHGVGGPDRTCAHCGRICPGTASYCGACGTPLPEAAP
ncbi:VWA domain-containing protein [Goodfellowiella coeruleoviolacea]|uniref:von Willebrand factor type A domain-containing protein n=1 Tax=Goodfellowiella coeruleoviolacea TaxID=334858 RepID=A0AAE3KFD6_9PSEU|nr:VWA domain-containing protein [Goodfellowiella coeruleoviolacea]MCP2164314.1 von Willebrand factor type A domain-containing protein [Goodfellowiella coeruleoviolacea]